MEREIRRRPKPYVELCTRREGWGTGASLATQGRRLRFCAWMLGGAGWGRDHITGVYGVYGAQDCLGMLWGFQAFGISGLKVQA